jgi:hypothetical protein
MKSKGCNREYIKNQITQKHHRTAAQEVRPKR